MKYFSWFSDGEMKNILFVCLVVISYIVKHDDVDTNTDFQLTNKSIIDLEIIYVETTNNNTINVFIITEENKSDVTIHNINLIAKTDANATLVDEETFI